MMVVAAGVLRLGQFALADRTVAIGVELGEQCIGAGFIDAVTTERRLEFRLTDLPVTIGIELGEQLRLALRGGAARRLTLQLTLQRNQRGHHAGVERRLVEPAVDPVDAAAGGDAPVAGSDPDWPSNKDDMGLAPFASPAPEVPIARSDCR